MQNSSLSTGHKVPNGLAEVDASGEMDGRPLQRAGKH